MTDPSPQRRRGLFRTWLSISAILALIVATASWLLRPEKTPDTARVGIDPAARKSLNASIASVDAVFASDWKAAGIDPLPRADDLAVARRISLALTGSIPSLEEIRTFESLPEQLRLEWWTDRLLSDPRSADYVAERFARAFVGVEGGPFLVYRRLSLVRWISGQIQAGRGYDAMVRDLIAAEGLWTTNPAANFITSTIDNNKKEGPDQVRLAIRTTRGFLGVRIDCVQCHDDKFGDRWKQADFHQLAAFYAGSDMKLTGVRDDRNKIHEVRYRGEDAEHAVRPMVPFSPELLPDRGRPRERLAVWATHPKNLPFARAAANRAWAILFGKPLVEPIDDISLDSREVPPALEALASDFIIHDFDLRRLFSVIAGTRAFRTDSRSPDADRPATTAQETRWAAFPITRLRPEQIAGSVIQSTYLNAMDSEAPFLLRLAKFGQTNEFVKRHGDLGEGEFDDPGGTIPQRLLLMNGKIVKERLDRNPFISAATRIRNLAPDPAAAIDAAYLCAFTRRPTPAERDHFSGRIGKEKGKSSHQGIEDLFWTLLNSTEFSWNH